MEPGKVGLSCYTKINEFGLVVAEFVTDFQ
jgi:hypothetical protein